MTLPANIETSWIPIAPLKSLRNKPIKRILAGVPIVLWRSGNDILAAKDRCPHRNYPLSKGTIKNGALICPYHGWEFSNEYACTKIPGSCPTSVSDNYKLEKIEVRIIYDAIFVCLRPAQQSLDEIISTLPPIPDNNDFDFFWWELKPSKARVYDALDNVLDPFHTNFIHDGFIRSSKKRQKVNQTIETSENNFTVSYFQDADYGWMSKALEGARTKSTGTYYPPASFQGRWEGPKGLNLCVTIWFVPESTGYVRSIIRFSMAKHRGPKWLKEAMIRLFLIKVIEQDADALKKLSNNIESFGAPSFKSGPDDRLSKLLSDLYNGKSLNANKIGPFEIWL